MNSETLKKEVRKTYANIANKTTGADNCCDAAGCCAPDSNVSIAENYTKVEGYQKPANLELGCGLPTESANIQKGDTVIDLGSGAGNDAFIAREIVGDSGKVIGLDMTPDMVIKVLQNNQIKKEREIHIQDEYLLKHLNSEELRAFRTSSANLYRITVYAEKREEGPCCETTESGCCVNQESASKADSSCCDTSQESGHKCCS